MSGRVLGVLGPACLEGSKLLGCEADGGGGVAGVAATDPAWKKLFALTPGLSSSLKDVGNVNLLIFTIPSSVHIREKILETQRNLCTKMSCIVKIDTYSYFILTMVHSLPRQQFVLFDNSSHLYQLNFPEHFLP